MGPNGERVGGDADPAGVPPGPPLLSYATPTLKPPIDCPRCGRALHLNARLRPEPKLSVRGWVLMTLAVLSGSATFLVVGVLLGRSRLPPVCVFVPAVLVATLVPGLTVGYLAHRLPKVQILRCAGCGWVGQFPIASP